MGSGTRHPILVDTDALIAVANTALWPKITETLNLTTTNVCIQELKRHVQETSDYPLDGTREQWIRNGSKDAIVPFEDDSNSSLTVVSSVPRPHGGDAGEQSLQPEVSQHPGTYTYVVSMDQTGRKAINREFDQMDTVGTAVAPPFLLYLLFDAGACTKGEFCQACGELLKGEGWTGYQAVQAAWEAIPVDCSEFLSDDVLPN